MPGKNSIPDIPVLNSPRDSMPIRCCRSNVPTGSPVLLVRWAAEQPCSGGFRRSPCLAASPRETTWPADFRDRPHRNSQADAALNAPPDSARIHPETAARSMPDHATQVCATAAFHPSGDAARYAPSAGCFPDHPAGYSSLAAEGCWNAQLLRHSSPDVARCCSVPDEPSFRGQRVRELGPTRFPVRAE